MVDPKAGARLENAAAIEIGEGYVVRLRERSGRVEIFIHRVERKTTGAVEVLPSSYVLGSNYLKWKI